MTAKPQLTLYEEILLLALDDAKGTTAVGSMHANAMGGAILAELVLLGAVTVGADKKTLVDARPDARADDPILAECLALVQEAKRRRKASDWVLKFAGRKDLRNRAARGLVAKGVLREGQDKVLGLFPRVIFPARQPGPEQELVKRLHHAVFTASTQVDERTVVVVVIAHATGLLAGVLDKKRLKERKERLKKLAAGHAAGAATREAVAAVQAAVMVATIAATTAATTAATS
ncbi:MAG: GPP34 family phosphoprotein [Krumholzibacteria bacterium]|nr:GPP34 family phosphoprotein [Candidatus Krumholzibacteria bacterium]